MPKLGLIFRTGKRIYIPYAYQPYIEYNPSEGLSIFTAQFKIIIKGRGLNELIDFLYNDSIEWIKESNKRMDDKSETVYIESIELQGELFE